MNIIFCKSWAGKTAELIEHYSMGEKGIAEAVKKVVSR